MNQESPEDKGLTASQRTALGLQGKDLEIEIAEDADAGPTRNAWTNYIVDLSKDLPSDKQLDWIKLASSAPTATAAPSAIALAFQRLRKDFTHKEITSHYAAKTIKSVQVDLIREDRARQDDALTQHVARAPEEKQRLKELSQRRKIRTLSEEELAEFWNLRDRQRPLVNVGDTLNLHNLPGEDGEPLPDSPDVEQRGAIGEVGNYGRKRHGPRLTPFRDPTANAALGSMGYRPDRKKPKYVPDEIWDVVQDPTLEEKEAIRRARGIRGEEVRRPGNPALRRKVG